MLVAVWLKMVVSHFLRWKFRKFVRKALIPSRPSRRPGETRDLTFWTASAPDHRMWSRQRLSMLLISLKMVEAISSKWSRSSRSGEWNFWRGIWKRLEPRNIFVSDRLYSRLWLENAVESAVLEHEKHSTTKTAVSDLVLCWGKFKRRMLIICDLHEELQLSSHLTSDFRMRSFEIAITDTQSTS